MRIEEIEIHVGPVEAPHRKLGHVEVTTGLRWIGANQPTIEEANLKLREAAQRLGANAVAYVTYDRRIKVLAAPGIAIALAPDKVCSYCECGEELRDVWQR
jgi:hypothetical protein